MQQVHNGLLFCVGRKARIGLFTMWKIEIAVDASDLHSETHVYPLPSDYGMGTLDIREERKTL